MSNLSRRSAGVALAAAIAASSSNSLAHGNARHEPAAPPDPLKIVSAAMLESAAATVDSLRDVHRILRNHTNTMLGIDDMRRDQPGLWHENCHVPANHPSYGDLSVFTSESFQARFPGESADDHRLRLAGTAEALRDLVTDDPGLCAADLMTKTDPGLGLHEHHAVQREALAGQSRQTLARVGNWRARDVVQSMGHVRDQLGQAAERDDRAEPAAFLRPLDTDRRLQDVARDAVKAKTWREVSPGTSRERLGQTAVENVDRQRIRAATDQHDRQHRQRTEQAVPSTHDRASQGIREAMTRWNREREASQSERPTSRSRRPGHERD